MLIAETKELNLNTVARKYQREYAKAEKAIKRTFDRQLSDGQDDALEVDIRSV